MKQVSAAFVKAQRAFGPALKTNENSHFRNKYAALDACVEAVLGALNDNGLALMQKTHQDDSGVTVETLFIHESGEVMSAGTLHFPAAKQDAQGYMSALTYCRRGSLMAACGIAPEDDDGNAASRTKPAAVKEVKVMGGLNNIGRNIPPERIGVLDKALQTIALFFNDGDIQSAWEAYDEFQDDERLHLQDKMPRECKKALLAHFKDISQQPKAA
jgi:AcrR family transcriptional regulator